MHDVDVLSQDRIMLLGKLILDNEDRTLLYATRTAVLEQLYGAALTAPDSPDMIALTHRVRQELRYRTSGDSDEPARTDVALLAEKLSMLRDDTPHVTTVSGGATVSRILAWLATIAEGLTTRARFTLHDGRELELSAEGAVRVYDDRDASTGYQLELPERGWRPERRTTEQTLTLTSIGR